MAYFGLFILARGSWNGTQILTDTVYFRRIDHPQPNLEPLLRLPLVAQRPKQLPTIRLPNQFSQLAHFFRPG